MVSPGGRRGGGGWQAVSQGARQDFGAKYSDWPASLELSERGAGGHRVQGVVGEEGAVSVRWRGCSVVGVG